MMSVDDVLRMAKSAGVTVLVEGYDLILEHEADPPSHLVAMLRHYKRELVGALRMREAEQRSLITQWINDHFTSSPAGVCAHCGGGPRPDDPFVLLFVGTDRGEVHSSCHSTWLAEREAEARKALGLEAHSAGGNADPSNSRTNPQRCAAETDLNLTTSVPL
jgi:hypothetical protein